MKERKIGTAIVCAVCAFLVVSAFFAKDFVLYDFHMDVPDYRYTRSEEERPRSADSSVWFSYGSQGKEFRYGMDEAFSADDLTIYSLAQDGDVSTSRGNENPIRSDSLGHFIAALPMAERDVDGDGIPEKVYDFARGDLGPNAFNPAPQKFHTAQIPFELVFAERKYIMVYYENEILTNGEILVTSYNGEQKVYRTDDHGWILGLSNRDIREGFTAAYSPDGDTLYRMHYALEDYPYFSANFFAAHIPLAVIFALAVLGIVAVHLIRNWMAKGDPAYEIYSRE